MSQWTDALRNHPIWASLNNLGPALDQALDRQGISPADIEVISRVKTVLAATGKHLAGIDPHLISFAHLNNVANLLNQAASEAGAYASNGNSVHLANANAQAEAVIQNLAVIGPVSTEAIVWAKDAAEAYQHGLATLLAEAKAASGTAAAEVGALKARVGELTTEIANEKQRVTALTSEFQKQFSSAQEARSNESAALQKQHDGALSTLQREHAQKLEEAAKRFEEARAKAVSEQETLLGSLRQAFVESAERMTQEIENHRAQVEKLVGVIGDLGVTSGFKVAAERAEKAARNWRLGTVAALIGLVAVAAITLFQIVRGEFTWLGLSGRVFISVAFGVLAAYCGAQAEKYHRTEIGNRKLALELAALGPYLAPLPKEKQDEFRLSIGARTFGQEDGVRANEVRSPTTALEVLNSKEVGEIVIGLLRRMVK